MKVVPNTVSGRVVNTSISASPAPGPAGPPSGGAVAKETKAPAERPIQLRCMVLIESDHSSRPRSSSSRSA